MRIFHFKWQAIVDRIPLELPVEICVLLLSSVIVLILSLRFRHPCLLRLLTDLLMQKVLVRFHYGLFLVDLPSISNWPIFLTRCALRVPVLC